jgi:hypothetical protein
MEVFMWVNFKVCNEFAVRMNDKEQKSQTEAQKNCPDLIDLISQSLSLSLSPEGKLELTASMYMKSI